MGCTVSTSTASPAGEPREDYVAVKKRPACSSHSDHQFTFRVVKSEEAWKEQLSKEAFESLRLHVTEKPGSGAYWIFDREGIFNCRACGEPLFASGAKLESEERASLPRMACFSAQLGCLVEQKKSNHEESETKGESKIMLCGGCGGFVCTALPSSSSSSSSDRVYAVNSHSIVFEGAQLGELSRSELMSPSVDPREVDSVRSSTSSSNVRGMHRKSTSFAFPSADGMSYVVARPRTNSLSASKSHKRNASWNHNTSQHPPDNKGSDSTHGSRSSSISSPHRRAQSWSTNKDIAEEKRAVPHTDLQTWAEKQDSKSPSHSSSSSKI